jgi:hypothetical protein
MRRAVFSFLLFSALGFGQEARLFYFTHNESAQEMNEVGTLLRTIGDIKELAVDVEKKSISMRGSAAQAALADWLFAEIDKPGNQMPLAQRAADTAVHEFPMPGNKDDLVRVFYLPRTETIQDFQEIATSVRTTGEVRRVFTYNSRRALVMRGTPGQMAFADFALTEMSQPASPPPPKREHLVDGSSNDVVRVFRLPYTKSIQEFQNAATLVRSIGEIRRVFTYNTGRAVTVRGTPEQIEIAEWLFGELGKTSDSSKREFWVGGRSSDVVRVFALNGAAVNSSQEAAARTRAVPQIRLTFTYDPSRLLVVRAPLDQIQQAEQMMKEMGVI